MFSLQLNGEEDKINYVLLKTKHKFLVPLSIMCLGLNVRIITMQNVCQLSKLHLCIIQLHGISIGDNI